MSSPHIIRLRGPWERLVRDDALADDELRATVQMPSSWVSDLGQEFRGCVRYRRFFNEPTGIDHATAIWLAFERIVGHAKIELNGAGLGAVDWPHQSERFDVSSRLEHRNELVVIVESLSNREIEDLDSAERRVPAGGLVGEVRLEIG